MRLVELDFLNSCGGLVHVSKAWRRSGKVGALPCLIPPSNKPGSEGKLHFHTPHFHLMGGLHTLFYLGGERMHDGWL